MQMFCARHKCMKRMRFSAVTAVRKLGEDGFPVSQPLIDAWNETLAPVVCQGARGPSRTRVPTDLKSRGLMPTWLGSSEGIEVYLKVIGKALVMELCAGIPSAMADANPLSFFWFTCQRKRRLYLFSRWLVRCSLKCFLGRKYVIMRMENRLLYFYLRKLDRGVNGCSLRSLVGCNDNHSANGKRLLYFYKMDG